MSELICKKCGEPREPGRGVCHKCHLASKREYAKKEYEEKGRKWYYPVCIVCSREFRVSRKGSVICGDCRKKIPKKSQSSTQYEYSKKGRGRLKWQHRLLAEDLIGRKLKSHEVVHHMDENKSNNDPENLLLLSRAAHTRLHKYLDKHRDLLMVFGADNVESKWSDLLLPVTKLWIDTTGHKLVKLWTLRKSTKK